LPIWRDGEPATPKRSSTRESVVFTPWPPGPDERLARNSSSATGTAIAGVMRITSLIFASNPQKRQIAPRRRSLHTVRMHLQSGRCSHSRRRSTGQGEEQMRARSLAVMVTATVRAARRARAGRGGEPRPRRKAMVGQSARAAVIANGETRENLEQVVVNHLGNPDQGQVLIQTWVEPDWSNFEAVDIQAAAQAGKIRRARAGFAKRIAIRVERDGDGNLHASSSTVNTGDVNGTAYVQTPEAGDLTNPDRPCLWFSVAYYTIRWDDNTLTSGRVLVALGDWVNPPCLLTPTSDLRARCPPAAVGRPRRVRPPRRLGVLGQVVGRVDEGHVRERLGEVPQLAAAGRIELLGQQADVVAQGEQPLEEGQGLVAPAHQGQVVGQPEGAGQERPLPGREPVHVLGVLGRGGGGQPVRHQLALGGGPRPPHPRVAGGKEPDQRDQQQAGVQAVGPLETQQAVPARG